MTDSSPNHKTVVRGNDERPGKPRVRKRGQPAVYYEIAGSGAIGAADRRAPDCPGNWVANVTS